MAPKPKRYLNEDSVAAKWFIAGENDIDPSTIAAGCNKRYRFKCDVADDHIWETTPNSLKGCPFCSVPPKRVSKSNCLATLRPEVIEFWNVEKNSPTTPNNAIAYSNKNAWFQCPKCRHEWKTSIGGFQGCAKCANNIRYTLEEMKAKFAERGCILLATEYVNAHTKMPFICICGEKNEMHYNNFSQGKLCRKCAINRRRGEQNNNWNPNREEVSRNKLLHKRFRTACRTLLRRLGKPKENRTHEIVGYSAIQFRERMITHPNWRSEWEILRNRHLWETDHIFPVKAFQDYGIDDEKVINALDNLQPLEALENTKKGDSYNPIAFEEYLRLKGISEYLWRSPSQK